MAKEWISNLVVKSLSCYPSMVLEQVLILTESLSEHVSRYTTPSILLSKGGYALNGRP